MAIAAYLHSEFPLVARELLQLGRRLNTYMARTALALSPLVVVLPAWWFRVYVEGDSIVNYSVSISRGLMMMVLGVQMLAVYLAAPAVSTSLLTNEKEENALSLLVMADRSGWDILFSKFIAAYLHVLLLILCFVPIQAMGLILGGGDLGVVIVRALLLTSLSAAIIAIGLFCSLLCQRSATAGSLTVFLMVLILGPITGWDIYQQVQGQFSCLSPVTATIVMRPEYVLRGEWFIAMAITWAVFGIWMVLSHSALARVVVKDGAARPSTVAEMRQSGLMRKTRNPVEALVRGACMRGKWADHPLMWMVRFFGAFVLGLMPPFGWILIFALLMRSIVQALVTMRNSLAWAELSLIPDDDRTLGKHVWRAFARDAAYVLIAGLPALLIMIAMVHDGVEYWLTLLFLLGVPYLILLFLACVTGSIAAGLQPKDQRQCEYGASYRMLTILFGGWGAALALPNIVVESIRQMRSLGWAYDMLSGPGGIGLDGLFTLLVVIGIAWNFVLVIGLWRWDSARYLHRLRRAYR